MMMEISTSTNLRAWSSLSVTIAKSCVLLGAEQERCSSLSFITYTIAGVVWQRKCYCLTNPECLPELAELLKKAKNKKPKKNPTKNVISTLVRKSQLGHDKRDADGNTMVAL